MLRSVEVHFTRFAHIPKLVLPLLGNDGMGPFHIRNIEGLGSVKATLNSRQYGGLDGEYYTGAQIGKRNIVLTLGLNPSAEYRSVAAFRKVLYGYLAPKSNPTLTFITEDRPPVKIEGYVESFEGSMFSKDPEVQISIVCPKPHFESAAVKTVMGIASRNPLDTVFQYDSDVANGIVFQLFKGTQDYGGPITIELSLSGPLYRKFKTVSLVNAGRYYTLNSQQGIKTVESRHRTTDARLANLLGTVTDDSIWPYVAAGPNKIRVKIDSDIGMPWLLYYRERFGGL